jgi:hypothetical protein
MCAQAFLSFFVEYSIISGTWDNCVLTLSVLRQDERSDSSPRLTLSADRMNSRSATGCSGAGAGADAC